MIGPWLEDNLVFPSDLKNQRVYASLKDATTT